MKGQLNLAVLTGLACVSSAGAQWASLPSVPEARSRAAGALVGDTFYFIGGETTGGVRNVTCWKLQVPAGSWTPIANMPGNGIGAGGVSNVDAAAVGTKVYLAGGWQGTAATNPLLEYDTASDTWTTVASDPHPTLIYANATVAAGGKVYVICGATASGVLSATCRSYDPGAAAGARWTSLAAPPTGRQYPGAVHIAGKIYVAGGIGATTAVEYNTADVYDIAANTWSSTGLMSAARGGPAFFNRGGEPYIVAGGWATYLTSGEKYTAGAWAASDPCIAGLRTIAYDGNDQFLVKAGGWAGTYVSTVEYFDLPNACYPDCNADGSLTVADFGCFQTKFVGGDPYADCNGDGSLTVADFGCFQTKFVAGCP